MDKEVDEETEIGPEAEMLSSGVSRGYSLLAAFRAATGKRGKRTEKTSPSIGSADARVTQIPAGVRSQRHLQFRQAHPSQVVAIGIRSRNQHGKRLSHPRRLVRNNP